MDGDGTFDVASLISYLMTARQRMSVAGSSTKAPDVYNLVTNHPKQKSLLLTYSNITPSACSVATFRVK